MKKFYMLGLCLVTISSVFAQQGYPSRDGTNDGYAHSNSRGVYNRDEVYNSPSAINKGGVYNRDYDRSDSRYNRRYVEQYSFSLRERDARILQVYREYENRAASIRYNRFMSNSSKRWELRKLNNQREQEIRMILARFDDNRNKYNDRYYDRNFNWRN